MSAPPGTQRGPAPATGAEPNRCDAATKQNVSLKGTAALRLIQRHTPTTGWHVIGKVTVVTAERARKAYFLALAIKSAKARAKGRPA